MSMEAMLLLQAMVFPTLVLVLAAGIYLLIRMKRRASVIAQALPAVVPARANEKHVSPKQ